MEAEAPPPPQAGSYVIPLAISAGGIICFALAIVAYHFILLRFFLRPQRMRQGRGRGHKRGGVEQEILNKIPILSYSTQKGQGQGEAFRLDQSDCPICLGELEDGVLVRLLPACRHAFHIPCIDPWFIDHSNCPVCRSPITSAWPKASENGIGGELQKFSGVPGLGSDDDHRLVDGDDLSASTSRIQQPHPPRLLRHSVSVAFHTEKKPRTSGMGLKRSLSMDQSSSYVVISIPRDHHHQENGSSSSTKGVVLMSQYNYKTRSLRHLDHMSSMLMRSFSQFRNSRNGRSNAILPI